MAVSNAGSIQMDFYNKEEMQWSTWHDRLEGMFAILDIKTEEKKRMNILHYIGLQNYENLVIKLSPVKPKDRTYTELVQLLESEFSPAPNEIVENYRFHLRKQRDGESINDFVAALRKLAIKCKFDTYLNTALRNQLVFGLRSQKVQARLLEEKDLTYELAIQKAKAMEMSHQGGAEIHQQKNNAASINYVDKKRNQHNSSRNKHKTSNNKNHNSSDQVTNKIKCYRCGSEKHIATKCEHKNMKCHHCNKIGHMKAVCFKLKNEKTHTNLLDDEVEIEEIYSLDDSNTICSEDFAHYGKNFKNGNIELHEMSNTVLDACTRDKIFLDVQVENRKMRFELDSGAPVSVLNLNDKIKYFDSLEINKTSTI